ncbi:DUF4192 domain-containing protein [Kitasatospora sp. NBC_00315]|uniref:DUF4192 domain-containing protein n=1 Tax=Kitasatospora sp. NBC_00315 TaxID=2975963 RepID=UPI0032469C2D
MNDERSTLSSNPLPGHLPVRMRGPADMAELLPYLLGFFPDDSIVAVGLHGADLEQGGVIRLDIPESPEEWQEAAGETAALLVRLSEQRGGKPAQVLLYLCQDPDPGRPEDPGHAPDAADGATGADPATRGPGRRRREGRTTVERLEPLAEELRAAFELRGVKVKESLCVSDGRWWSFLCNRTGCCEPTGTVIRRTSGPGPVVAAATFAGLAPRGSRKAIMAGLAPIDGPEAERQRLALERFAHPAGGLNTPEGDRAGALLDEVMAEFIAGARGIDEHRAALLLTGLQDKRLRDRAAEFAEPDELAGAQRLWRFLAQRCVIPYDECASAPLTLLAWTSWLAGDSATARIALARVLKLDPYYLLAQLLHESLNGGLPPDLLLKGLRAERARRGAAGARPSPGSPSAPGAPPGASPGTPLGAPPSAEGAEAAVRAAEESGPGAGPGAERGPEPEPEPEPGGGPHPGAGRGPDPLPGPRPSARWPSARRVRLRRRILGRTAEGLADGSGAGCEEARRAAGAPGGGCRARNARIGS